MSSKIVIPDEQIRKMAEDQKQLDLNYVQRIRQHFSNLNFSGIHVELKIKGLEELESKPLEVYEKEIRERFNNLFSS